RPAGGQSAPAAGGRATPPPGGRRRAAGRAGSAGGVRRPCPWLLRGRPALRTYCREGGPRFSFFPGGPVPRLPARRLYRSRPRQGVRLGRSRRGRRRPGKKVYESAPPGPISRERATGQRRTAMPRDRFNTFLGELRRAVLRREGGCLTDGQLLERY